MGESGGKFKFKRKFDFFEFWLGSGHEVLVGDFEFKFKFEGKVMWSFPTGTIPIVTKSPLNEVELPKRPCLLQQQQPCLIQ